MHPSSAEPACELVSTRHPPASAHSSIDERMPRQDISAQQAVSCAPQELSMQPPQAVVDATVHVLLN